MSHIRPPSAVSSTTALELRLALLESLLSGDIDVKDPEASDVDRTDYQDAGSLQDVQSRVLEVERRLHDVVRSSGSDSVRRFVDQCELR
jgi:hypothetical protein